MSPELDQTLVFGAIGIAVGYFVMRFVRNRSKRGSCGGGCCTTQKPVLKRQ